MTLLGSSRKQLTPLEPLVGRIEEASALDAPAAQIGKTLRGAISGDVKDVASGTWLGHAVHPLLTDVVIGSFMSASLLDLLGGDGAAAERLIGIGIAAYGPTALTGANDWADSEAADPAVRRAGLVHAATNAVGLVFYVASLRARRRGRRIRGALLGFAGFGVLSAGGYLGGHLTYSRGVGGDQTAYDPGPDEWTEVTEAPSLGEGTPTRVVVDDTPVLLVRHGETIHAIHDRCSHRGCSLSQGEIDGEQVVCACHGSRFDLRDGSVRGGPATAPQPAFLARQQAGRIELRRAR